MICNKILASQIKQYIKMLYTMIKFGYIPGMQGCLNLIPKPEKDNTQKRKLQANITDEHRCKTPQQRPANQLQ